ncbi:amino acid adenylation domain-containing protein, partial [Streptomyces katrae]
YSSTTDMPADLRGSGWNRAAGTEGLIPRMDWDMPAASVLDVNALVTDGEDGPQLTARFAFPAGLLSREDVQELAGLWHTALEALARHAVQPGSGGLTPSDVPLVTVRQHDLDTWRAQYPGLTDVWPLTGLQEGLLFHALLAGSSYDAYHMQMVHHLSGPVDPDRMRRAGQALLDRHPNLRTAFVPGPTGDRVQLVVDGVRLPWHHHDLRHAGEAERAAELARVVREDQDDHFDPVRPPLLRMTLLTTGPDRAELVMTAHHVLFDGWSVPLLMRDLMALYAAEGDPAALPRVRGYRDFLAWLADQDRDAAAHAWAGELDGVDEPTLLAPDAGTELHTEVGQVAVPLPADLARDLARRAAQLGITLNTLVQGGWALLLGALTGRRDVVFGTTVSGRPPAVTGVDGIVGLFINTLPVRVDCSPARSLGDLLTDLQDRQAALLDHHHHVLADIQSAAGLPALFDTVVVFESYPVDRAGINAAGDAAEVAITGLTPFTGSHYPLVVTADADPHLRLALQYHHHAFGRDAVTGIAERFGHLLRLIAEDPELPTGRIDLLGTVAADGRTPADRPADIRPPVPAATFPDLFRTHAAARPDALAVEDDRCALSYAELDARSDRLAHHLKDLGAGPGTIVALCLERGADLLTGMLGIMKAGAAYVPLDPGYPADRLAYMLADSGATHIVTAGAARTRLAPGDAAVVDLEADHDRIAARPATAPVPRPRPEDLAYVVYTSGSTGRPKGVLVTHTGFAGLAAAMTERMHITPDSRVLQFASASFDGAAMEVLMALASGAALVLPPHGPLVGDALGRFLRERRITHTLLVPSLVATLDPEGLDGLRTLVVGAEATGEELVQRWAPGRRLINAYGPTETTIVATLSEPLTGPGTPPIGRPLPHTRIHLLDHALRPVSTGVPGELYIAGPHLARGYHGRSALTAARFTADPYGGPGERMYRSGDIARRREDGTLEYLGRADDQVKIRGFRIELGEVENVLSGHPGVEQAVAVVREGPSGGRILVAYAAPAAPAAPAVPAAPVVPAATAVALPGTTRPDTGPLAAALRAHAEAGLPGYMVPTAFVLLDALPTTPSGKLDRAALPAPELGGADGGREPRTVREEVLCTLFAEVLGVRTVGIDEDFFALGGHSLLATRLIGRIRATLGAEVPLRALFDAPTVAKLALQPALGAPARPELRRVDDRPDRVPLSFAQRRIWFVDRFEGASATYNLPLVLRLSGPLDLPALHRALHDMTARHEALRTLIGEDADGVPYQQVLPAETVEVPLPVVACGPGEPQTAEAAVARAVSHIFDLAADLPLRATLLRLGPAEHRLVLVLHHIAGDGESIPPLMRDLGAAYEARLAGRDPGLPAPAVRYTDYAGWQRDLLGDEADPLSLMARQSAYWRTELEGLPQPIALPTDRPRPTAPSHRGGLVEFTLDPALAQSVADLGRAHGATVSMVLQAALAVLLRESGAGDDVSIGSPIAGRTDEALADLVGFFVNTWVLRVRIDSDPSFADVLAQVRDRALAAYDNQDVPFERLVEHLNPDRSTSHHPLFQVMFGWQHIVREDFELSGLRVSLDTVANDTAKFDLFLTMADIPGTGVVGGLEYATDLYDHATAERFTRRFTDLLARVAETPDRPLPAPGTAAAAGPVAPAAAVDHARVEEALTAHPGVAEAVVIAHDGSGSGRRLVAYTVPATPDEDPTDALDLTSGASAAQLRDLLTGRLPAELVPAVFVSLPELPLGPDGRPDHAALPEPVFTGGDYRAPGTRQEQVLAEVYAEVLGLDRVGVDDDYFLVGGDSIRSIQVVARARARGVSVTPRQIFELRTVAELASAATLTEGATTAPVRPADDGEGWMPLLPIARHLLGL